MSKDPSTEGCLYKLVTCALMRQTKTERTVMKITTVVDVKTLNSLNEEEKLEAFAKINSKDLETLIHYAQVELQERALVEQAYEDDLLGKQTAEERRQWL